MKNLKYPLIAFFIFFSLVFVQILWAASTDLSLTVDAGTLSVDIVDDTGASVATPSVSFGNQGFSFDAQNFTGTLGTSTEKIRLSNPTTTAEWSVSFAATDAGAAVWDDGTFTFPYNADLADDGRLTVNPTVATIAGVDGCSTDNISKGAQGYFDTTVTTSIDLMTASVGAQAGCRWDLTSVELTQRIPAAQSPGNYTLNMTVSAI